MSTMRLCSTCNAIDIRTMLGQTISWTGSTMPEEKRHYKIHDTIAIMEERKDVCDLCAFLWKEWQYHEEPKWKKNLKKTSFDSLPSLSLTFRDISPPEVGFYIGVNLSSSEEHDYFTSTEHQVFANRSMLETERVPEDPVEDFLFREISSNSNTDEAFKLACQWYKKCLHDHPSCRRASELNFALPTRLIEVGDDTSNPRLYVHSSSGSEPTRGTWVSLSYCWGGDSKFILTKESMPSLLTGIPLNDFPKTLQDAILITRALGVRYLWIDALCIQQDSRQDWEQEAPKMSNIYANAVLTIVAATTPSVIAGIFQEREPTISCQLPWRQARRTDTSPTDTRSSNKDQEMSVGLRMTPKPIYENIWWAKRAWTLQECLLSWRILHYYPDQMAWSCLECTTLENGHTLRDADYVFSTEPITKHREFQLYKKELAFKRSEPSPQKKPGALEHLIKYQRWYTILWKYSIRSITKETDRLPGIGGLALSIAEDMQDTYRAGLWEKDLICGLAWKCTEGPPVTQSFPSWTWTSPGVPIIWVFNEYRDVVYTEIAHVEEIDIKYNSSPYGEVKSGRLVLSGPCYHVGLVNQTWEATTGQAGQPVNQSLAFNRFLNNEISTDVEIKAFIADHDALEKREYIILSLLSGGDKYGGKALGFLMLESLHAPGELGDKSYRRVGLLSLFARVYFGYNKESQLVLKELGENPWPRETVTIL